jgi:hypothetical protein
VPQDPKVMALPVSLGPGVTIAHEPVVRRHNASPCVVATSVSLRYVNRWPRKVKDWR